MLITLARELINSSYILSIGFPRVSLYRDECAFHQLGPLGRVGLVVNMYVCLCVCLCVCLMSPFHAIFSEASDWPSGHMISSWPLIGQPSFTFFAQKPLGGGGGNGGGEG